MGVAVLSQGAQASIIYNYLGVTPTGSDFTYSYDAFLSADQKVDTTQNSSFATIIDFGTLISSSLSNVLAGTSFTVTTSFVGPAAANQNPFDDPNILNVTVTADPGSMANPGVSTRLYTVDLVSPVGPNTKLVFQDAEATKNAPGTLSDNTPSGNTVSIEGPIASGVATPEPASMMMIGSGLLGLAGLLRKLNRV